MIKQWLIGVALILLSGIASAAPVAKISVDLAVNPAGTILIAPGLVNLTSNASAKQKNHPIVKLEFYQGTNLIGTATAAPYTYSWSGVAAGTYSLTARATNDKGDTAESTPISVRIDAPPTVSITSPNNNAKFITPTTITLNANAADSDGTIAQVQFFQGSTLLSTVTSPPYSYAWVNPVTGTYALFAKATDNDGAKTTSNAVNINVVANIPPTVSISSPSPNTNYTAPALIHIVANAADIDGNVFKVEFYNGTTLLSTATTEPYTYDFNNVQPGSYNIIAKATDNLGASTSSATIPVTVISGIAQLHYIFTDQLDTPRLITDDKNIPVWRWDSDPFGATQPNQDPNLTGNLFNFNLRFPGQYADVETGLNYNYFRDYDPATGRYIESDPIGLMGGVNTFGYAEGDVIDAIDPFGLSTIGYDGQAKRLTATGSDGTPLGSFPANNNTTRKSNGPWPNGTFPYDHSNYHPESDENGKYGSHGIFVFKVPGRPGIGVHSGREDKGAQNHPTLGCVRTTDEGMAFLRSLTEKDPITSITITNNSKDAKRSGNSQ